MIKYFLSLIVAVFISCETDTKPELKVDKLLFFNNYYKSNKIIKENDSLYRINLVGDLHFADGVAPDCFGTKISISMNVHNEGDKCILDSTIIKTQNFFDSGCKYPHSENDTLEKQGRYITHKLNINLCDTTIDKITFWNTNDLGALILLKDDFFYYKQAKRGDSLVLRLENENDTISPNVHFGITGNSILSNFE